MLVRAECDAFHAAPVEVRELRGRDAIGQPFELELQVVVANDKSASFLRMMSGMLRFMQMSSVSMSSAHQNRGTIRQFVTDDMQRRNGFRGTVKGAAR